MSRFPNLPTLAQVAAARAAKREPLLKGKSRLERQVEAKPLTMVDEKAFKAEVVTERIMAKGTAFVEHEGRQLIDARQPITFERVS